MCRHADGGPLHRVRRRYSGFTSRSLPVKHSNVVLFRLLTCPPPIGLGNSTQSFVNARNESLQPGDSFYYALSRARTNANLSNYEASVGAFQMLAITGFDAHRTYLPDKIICQIVNKTAAAQFSGANANWQTSASLAAWSLVVLGVFFVCIVVTDSNAPDAKRRSSPGYMSGASWWPKTRDDESNTHSCFFLIFRSIERR